MYLTDLLQLMPYKDILNFHFYFRNTYLACYIPFAIQKQQILIDYLNISWNGDRELQKEWKDKNA